MQTLYTALVGFEILSEFPIVNLSSAVFVREKRLHEEGSEGKAYVQWIDDRGLWIPRPFFLLCLQWSRCKISHCHRFFPQIVHCVRYNESCFSAAVIAVFSFVNWFTFPCKWPTIQKTKTWDWCQSHKNKNRLTEELVTNGQQKIPWIHQIFFQIYFLLNFALTLQKIQKFFFCSNALFVINPQTFLTIPTGTICLKKLLEDVFWTQQEFRLLHFFCCIFKLLLFLVKYSSQHFSIWWVFSGQLAGGFHSKWAEHGKKGCASC